MAESFVTSFVGLVSHEVDGAPPIERIEIPLIQRDYAQGRTSPSTDVIRANFLQVLHDAATGGEPVGLDFVYGEVRGGALQPLDGQQRLTALFLLHWYIAARTSRVTDPAPSWATLSYSTRFGARIFCERLGASTLPEDFERPTTWIQEQPWYLYAWRHDPTVQSMLVVLDDIHDLFDGSDLDAAWERLVHPESPGISFHLLPVEDMGSAEDLYIKMNSRGRPLTDFENFKARFQKAIDESPRAADFAHRIDTVWAVLLWLTDDGDDAIDGEFLRYIEFVVELCEWRDDVAATKTAGLLERAARSLGPESAEAEQNLELLFYAFDTWVDQHDVDEWFHDLFSTTPALAADGSWKVVLFGQEPEPNLFRACCHSFGTERFGIARRLLLYAVLLHRRHQTDDFAARVRTLRNLLAASEDELRPALMHDIVSDVERVIVSGDLDKVLRLNQAQLGDELAKQAFLEEHPDLRNVVSRLEDHDLLRGSLVALSLDADALADRADAFEEVLSSPELIVPFTGALLATGEYHRQIRSWLQFGAPEASRRWRDLLTGTSRTDLSQTRLVLEQVLDTVARSDAGPKVALEAITDAFVAAAAEEHRFDWRYYLVRYPEMRLGRSGVYRTADGELGYSLCMLDKQALHSNYRDPYLFALVRVAAVEEKVERGDVGPWFTGLATEPRWLRTTAGDLRMRCVDEGWALHAPSDAEHQDKFHALRASHGDIEQASEGFLLHVPQAQVDGLAIDSVDRIARGANFLRAAVDAGL